MIEWILKKIRNDNKGFTLIELVVVIAILAILAAIAVPRLGRSRVSAAVTAHNANVRTIESAATMYIADGGEDIVEQKIKKDEGVGKYLQEIPEIPKEAKIEGDPDGYEIKIDKGKITVTPGLRKINENGLVENKTTEQNN